MPDILTDRKTGKQFILSADVPTGTVTPPTPRYTVTITGGYINEDGVTRLTVDEGTTVTLIRDLPTSMQYPRFDHFAVEGGSDITTPPYTITVTRNLSITGVYVAQTRLVYTLQEGVTDVTPPEPHMADMNTTVTVTATLDDEHEFNGYYLYDTLLSESNPADIVMSVSSMPITVRAKLKQITGWSVDNPWTGEFNPPEDAEFDIFQALQCGVTGTWTVKITSVTAPQPNDTYDMYLNGESHTSLRGAQTFTTASASDTFNLVFFVSRPSHWEFVGEITCEGFDTPLAITILVN